MCARESGVAVACPDGMTSGEMVERSRRTTEIGGCRVHSVHAGSGAPLVLIHGLAGSHGWWRFTLEAFAAEFAVHVPELVGFGRTGAVRPFPTIGGMADVLASWMDALSLERVHVVGHSMGGQIALHLAARHPQRVARLVLVSSTGIPRPFRVTDLARLAAELIPPRAWGSRSFLPVIARDAVSAGPRVLWSALRNLLIDDVRPLLPHIEAETLLVRGELDPLIPRAHALELARGIRRARLAVTEGAAHNPMVDRPAAFLDLVLPFLRSGE